MELQKVTYIDLVTIIEAQNLNDIQDAIIDLEEWQTEAGAAIPQILANIAPSFSNSTSYSAGDCVIVLDKLYQFTADHPAGDWTGTDAEEVNVTSLLKEAAASLSGDIDSVKADALTAYATDTASGSIASFPDGADDIPVKDLSVGIEPVQDLHGYANPWPAGGGINLVDKVSLESYGGTVSADGLTVTSKVVTASGNSNLMGAVFSNPFDAVMSETLYVSVDVRLLAGTMDSFAIQLVGGSGFTAIGISKYAIVPSTTKQRISFSGSPNRDDQVKGIYIQAQNADGAQLEMSNIQISKAEDYNYHPYSNICPISGWTGANIAQGSGMLEITSFQQGIFTNSGQTAGAMYAVRTYFIPVESNTEYAFRCDLDGVTLQFFSYATGTGNPQSITRASADGKEVRITTGENDLFVRASIALKDQTKELTPADVDKAYLLTVTNDFSITFPISAGTVYGGTLDVTTGKLTVDRAMVDLGTVNWYDSTAVGYTRFWAFITDIERISSPNVLAQMLCSAYKTETANNTYLGRQGISLQPNANTIYVYDAQRESMTTADFKAAMSGVQLVYELATPIVYDLTPTEVTTLLAQNNIWADCGDSTVEYRADIKLYIDKKIAALAAAMN